jgi:pyruvate kinase
MPKTKIIATLGPATDREGVLRALLAAGVDVARLNMSYGSREEHAARITAVRSAAREADRLVAVLADLQGPKIRLGEIAGGGCTLEAGATFTITVEPVTGNCERASTGYAGFARDVKPGSRVLLADGAVELEAVDTSQDWVRTRVIRGGQISSRKGINLPGVKISAPPLTEKDVADLEFSIDAGADLIAQSFVRTAADVRVLQERVAGRVPVVAKIEKAEAWENIEAILDEADGMMVARGDLGVEVALERVPHIQKSVARRARGRGKFTIIATHMLESMIENATPTRAEVSDVANAIYDGADAVMLSAETATGKHPARAVEYMARIALETEMDAGRHGRHDSQASDSPAIPGIVAEAACRAARESGAAAIVVFTVSGSSARRVSRYRPPVPVYAMTPSANVARQLVINYGVQPVLTPDSDSIDEMLLLLNRAMVESGYLKNRDTVVFVAGQPVGQPGTTNLLKLHRIGD